eukprot:TRINITY_DN15453_c0_g2_i2.p1 TRINITY_DN15453_c0_g2~~TRINITY_DN15453_c0_g2_i2.p1  ORF type:complete len:405 (+),score=42.66 TRINITY_DN15453_c0_g2_i2:606-1820(+)
MDVKTAFLNGDLEEEIYMDQPEGYVIKGQEHKVCRLLMSLYGLKQAPKQWHMKFDEVILSNGFKLNEAEKCIYYKSDGDSTIILCLYVDDLLIFGTNLDCVEETKLLLSNNFDMKDLGEASVILGIRIIRDDISIKLSQSHYIEKVLRKFDHFNCKPVSTPFDPSIKLVKNNGDSVAQLDYASVIGSLMYAMNCTRPDVADAVSKLSRYTSNPGVEHWNAVFKVLKYLKHTIEYALYYSSFPAVVECYSDADWNTDLDDSKSTSGYIFTLGGAAISWKSKKQTTITQSTKDSEFLALGAAATEAEWIRNLLYDIPLWSKPIPPIIIHCDNTAAIINAHNATYNGKSRQVRLQHNYVRQLLIGGVIAIDYVKSKDNLADPLTKGLAREKIKETTKGMGLKPINHQ